MTDKKLLRDLSEEISNIRIFDTHEHLIYETERRSRKLDFFHFFIIYASTDLISSGLKQSDFEKLHAPDIDLQSKWEIFYPFWNHIKNTNYAKIIKIALKDIYEIEEVSFDSIKKVTDMMGQFNKTEYYKDLIREKANIEYILNDLDCMEENILSLRKPDKDYFLPVLRLDLVLTVNSLKKIDQLEEKNDISINDLSGFIKLIDKIFEERKGKIFGLKIGTAYFRDILFENTSYHQAENSFQKILKLKKHGDFFEDCAALFEIKHFQDFMHHYCIRKAIDYDLPVQIHTGILEGNTGDIRGSDPVYLTDLLLKYKQARFDIFHAGYPYSDKLTSMIKMYPNTYFNMCWIAGISKNLYKRIIDILIDLIPSNKIFGFGGDYLFVEGTYGAQKIAREALTEVLCKRIEEKYFTFEEAIEFAERILYLNPKNIYLK